MTTFQNIIYQKCVLYEKYNFETIFGIKVETTVMYICSSSANKVLKIDSD